MHLDHTSALQVHCWLLLNRKHHSQEFLQISDVDLRVSFSIDPALIRQPGGLWVAFHTTSLLSLCVPIYSARKSMWDIGKQRYELAHPCLLLAIYC